MNKLLILLGLLTVSTLAQYGEKDLSIEEAKPRLQQKITQSIYNRDVH